MLLLFANAVLRICIFRSFQYSTSPLQLVCVCIMNSKHSTYNSAACHKKMVLSVAPDRKKWCHFSAKSSTTPMFAVCRALRSPHAAWLTSANAIVVVDMACFCCLLTMSGQIRTNTAAFCFSTDAALNRLLVNFDFERPPLLLLPFASQCARNGQAVLLLNACLCNAHKHHSTYTEYTHINVRWVIIKKKQWTNGNLRWETEKDGLKSSRFCCQQECFPPSHCIYCTQSHIDDNRLWLCYISNTITTDRVSCLKCMASQLPAVSTCFLAPHALKFDARLLYRCAFNLFHFVPMSCRTNHQSIKFERFGFDACHWQIFPRFACFIFRLLYVIYNSFWSVTETKNTKMSLVGCLGN